MTQTREATRGRQNLERLLDVAVFAAGTVFLLAVALERFEWAWAGVRLRVSSPWRPLGVLVAVLAIRALTRWRLRMPDEGSRLAGIGLLALLTATAVTYTYFGVRICGGLDSYGYVSASQLIRSGSLRESQPLANLLPYPDAARVAAPLGFVVAADGISRVPRFPLGLPLVMAAFSVLGPNGPFLAPLVMALLALALAYAVGRWRANRISGLFAAAVVAGSPTFVNAAIQPMSDGAATCWLLAAVWLTIWRREWPVAAAVCAGMAIWTRPALVGAAAALVLVAVVESVISRRRPAHVLVLTGVMGAFVAALAWVNHSLFGAYWDSGYGSTAALFDPRRIGVNLWTYAYWITYSHGPWLWGALGLTALVLRRDWRLWATLCVALAAAAPYLLYFTWDDWEATRFVLPGLVLALILASRGVMVVLGSSDGHDPSASPPVRARVRPWIALLLAVAWAGTSNAFLRTHGVYDYWRAEAKYPQLGEWVRSHTTAAAVVISGLHSGSLRYYGGRDTLRWDEMPGDQLFASVASLEAHGHEVFVALDVPSEGERFRQRFELELQRVTLIPAASLGETHVYRAKARAPAPGAAVQVAPSITAINP